MTHALNLAPRQLPRSYGRCHVAVAKSCSRPLSTTLGAATASSGSAQSLSEDAPTDAEGLRIRRPILDFKYDEQRKVKAEELRRSFIRPKLPPPPITFKYDDQRQRQRHAEDLRRSFARPKVSRSPERLRLSGGINEKLEQLKEEGQKADYLRVKVLVKDLVLREGYGPDISIYEALLQANADPEHGSLAEISQWLQDMEEADVTLDAGTYHAILKALAVHPDQLLRDDILRRMRERWYSLTNEGHHYVAAGLLRERKLELAMDWLQDMREAKVKIEPWLYDLLVYSLCDVQEFDEALSVIKYRIEMEDLGTIATHGDHALKEFVSANVWYHLLDSASRAMHIEATTFAYKVRIAPGYLNPSAGVYQNILICAARSGDTQLATSVFNALSKRSGNPIQLHHFEILIEAYTNSGDIRTALALLSTIQQSGYLPCKASTRPIFAVLRGSNEDTRTALSTLQMLYSQNRIITLAALNLVIEAFIYLEDLEGALQAYNSLTSSASPSEKKLSHHRLLPDRETFSLLLQGCYQARDNDQATFLASEMTALGVKMDSFTYDTLIRTCIECDAEMDDAWNYVSEARGENIDIKPSTMQHLVEAAAAEESEPAVPQEPPHTQLNDVNPSGVEVP